MAEIATTSDRAFTFFKAGPRDAKALSRFISQGLLKGPIDLRVQRSEQFFEMYEYMGEKHETYAMENTEGDLVGCFTFLVRRVHIRGVLTPVGFIHDLRIATTRDTIRAFTQRFFPLITELQSGVEHVFTMTSESQDHLFQTLIRPAGSNRAETPRFHLVRRFEVIGVHGRYPQIRPDRISVTVDRAKSTDTEALAAYLQKQSKRRLFGSNFELPQFKERLASWPGFSIEKFFIARDSGDKIVGCVAPFEIDRSQSIRADRYHGTAGTARFAINLFAWTGCVHPLPNDGEPLPLSFLTHLNADNTDIFMSLVQAVRDQTDDTRSLIYSHFENNPMTIPEFPLVTSRFPFSLFVLVAPGSPTPSFIRSTMLEPPPELEPLLL